MKVLYLIDTLGVGGAERSVLEIATRISGGDVVVCTLYKNDELWWEYENSGLRYRPFHLDGKYSFVRGCWKFIRLLQEEKPDLVVATLLRSELVARVCCKLMKIPLVGTFVNDTYSPYELRHLPFHLKAKVLFFKRLNAFTSKWCVGFIANSEAVKVSNSRELNVPLSKIVVIPRGRRLPEYFRPVPAPDNGIFLFGNVGRLIRRKGQLDLLRAFRQCRNEIDDVCLLIAGSGLFETTLNAYVSETELEESVKFLGTIHDVMGFYRSCHASVFASHYEGFSGALLEAVLAGLPVIASDIPMNRELLPDDGAFFFPVGDSDALARCMVDVIKDYPSAQTRAAKAYHFAAERFGIDIVSKQHEAYYRSVLNRNS